MKKEIVGKFNNDLSKIEFYEITDSYRRFTVLRKKGTNEYYLWDNKYALLSDNLHIIDIPSNKKDYDSIISHVQTWYSGDVFFWSTSKFVTEYGFEGYEMLLHIYTQILSIREREIEILKVLEEVKANEPFIIYLRCLLKTKIYLRKQRKTIKALEKEFQIIW